MGLAEGARAEARQAAAEAVGVAVGEARREAGAQVEELERRLAGESERLAVLEEEVGTATAEEF